VKLFFKDTFLVCNIVYKRLNKNILIIQLFICNKPVNIITQKKQTRSSIFALIKIFSSFVKKKQTTVSQKNG